MLNARTFYIPQGYEVGEREVSEFERELKCRLWYATSFFFICCQVCCLKNLSFNRCHTNKFASVYGQFFIETESSPNRSLSLLAVYRSKLGPSTMARDDSVVGVKHRQDRSGKICTLK